MPPVEDFPLLGGVISNLLFPGDDFSLIGVTAVFFGVTAAFFRGLRKPSSSKRFLCTVFLLFRLAPTPLLLGVLQLEALAFSGVLGTSPNALGKSLGTWLSFFLEIFLGVVVN